MSYATKYKLDETVYFFREHLKEGIVASIEIRPDKITYGIVVKDECVHTRSMLEAEDLHSNRMDALAYYNELMAKFIRMNEDGKRKR